MSDYRAFIKELTALPGLSGYEKPVRNCILSRWESLVDEVWTSPLGSLHGYKHGKGEGKKPSILLAAHMDAIGLIVTDIQGEYLRITSVGGLDPRVLPYQEVIVHGREVLSGIIAMPTERHLPEDVHGKAMPLEHLFVDVGLPAETVKKLVRPGDLVSFANSPFELDEEIIVAHTLDDRASVAAVTICLEELSKRDHLWDVVAVATVQEEIGIKGARTSGFAENPDLAVAIDVTFADEPGASDYFLKKLDSGPAIGWGPVIHPALYKAFKDAAKRLELPVTMDVLPGGHTGTDADALTMARAGIPTIVLSIPLRYMHSPFEVVQYQDVNRCGRLMAELIASLPVDFVDKMEWDKDDDE